MKLGLLECDDVVGRFPGIEGGYREMFAELLPEFSFEYYDVHRGRLPVSPAECDAWICTGSKYSVYEKHDWIDALSAFIRRNEKPFVGICFGHQMLAHAMGGVVAKASQGWGIGISSSEIVRREAWMVPELKNFSIHHMHQDQVQALPPDAVVLARSPHCEVEMFRVGNRLGIEGHPEFTLEFSRALIEARRKLVGEKRSAEALASLRQPTDAPVVARWIAQFIGGRRNPLPA